MPETKFDVFVSYRRLDTARVAPFVEVLRRCGLVVWFDQEDISDLAAMTDGIPGRGSRQIALARRQGGGPVATQLAHPSPSRPAADPSTLGAVQRQIREHPRFAVGGPGNPFGARIPRG